MMDIPKLSISIRSCHCVHNCVDFCSAPPLKKGKTPVLSAIP
jgi:hypothetical protein